MFKITWHGLYLKCLTIFLFLSFDQIEDIKIHVFCIFFNYNSFRFTLETLHSKTICLNGHINFQLIFIYKPKSKINSRVKLYQICKILCYFKFEISWLIFNFRSWILIQQINPKPMSKIVNVTTISNKKCRICTYT